MIFPRLFTCPTLSTANFKLGNLLLHLKEDTMNVPLKRYHGMFSLYRIWSQHLSCVWRQPFGFRKLPYLHYSILKESVLFLPRWKKNAGKLSCLIIPFFPLLYVMMPLYVYLLTHSLQKEVIMNTKEKENLFDDRVLSQSSSTNQH
jgi:hypothetical protein